MVGISTAGRRPRITADQVRKGYVAAAERGRQTYHEAESCVQSHPVESLSTAFGSGLIAGFVVTLIVRR